MTKLYIVVEGGCVRYVSSNMPDNINVTVIDLDDLSDDPDSDMEDQLEKAETLPRVW